MIRRENPAVHGRPESYEPSVSLDDISGGTIGSIRGDIEEVPDRAVTVTDELNNLAANMALGRTEWAFIIGPYRRLPR